MKTRLSSGAELDLLNADELRTVLTETLAGYLRRPRRIRIEDAIATDSSGNGSGTLYRPRPGMIFLLNRLIVAPVGYTFDAPYSPASAGGVNIYRGGATIAEADLIDGYQFGTVATVLVGSLPAVIVESDSRAIEVKDGERLFLQIVGGPVSSAVWLHGHGLLSPIEPE